MTTQPKQLIIKGTVKEVQAIIDNLIYMHGRKTTIAEYLDKQNKNEVILI